MVRSEQIATWQHTWLACDSSHYLRILKLNQHAHHHQTLSYWQPQAGAVHIGDDAKRKEYSKVTGQKLSMLPFIMAAICKALKKHPTLNAITDDANNEILVKGPVNIGCAVDTDSGLMVPVIKDAEAQVFAEGPKKTPVVLSSFGSPCGVRGGCGN